jgi:hypothetical protein
MDLTKDKITEIFYLIDEFCAQFEASTASYKLGNLPKRTPRLSQSEVITLMTLFHYGCFRNIKHFYIHYAQKHLRSEFPQTVSYNRFVELMQSAVLPMALFLKTCCMGDCTGISYVDSTPIRVCKNKRIKRNKVFKDTATVGKSTMGWFLGLNCT